MIDSVTYRARLVFPVHRPPLDGGCVTVGGDGRIIQVDDRPPSDGPVIDLGDVALLPGLINAHAHLDLTDAARPLGEPGISLADWIPRVVAHRRRQGYSPRLAVLAGLEESLRLGTVATADIVQGDYPVEAVGPRRMVLYRELLAPTPDRVESARWTIGDFLQTPLPPEGEKNVRLGLSPHAPYSVRRDFLKEVAELSARQRIPLAMHLAESLDELELLACGGGPLRAMLESLGSWREDTFPSGSGPIDFLKILAGAHRATIVHGNYLDDESIALLGRRADRLSVVFCPRSHRFFGHRPYPLEKMLATGVCVALGTDSRASCPDLSILAEMRRTRRDFPDLPGETILRLGTLAGATALGMAARLGTLEPGKRADLVAVALPEDGADTTDPHDRLLRGEGGVQGVWLLGERMVY